MIGIAMCMDLVFSETWNRTKPIEYSTNHFTQLYIQSSCICIHN